MADPLTSAQIAAIRKWSEEHYREPEYLEVRLITSVQHVAALLAHIEARETERRDLISQAYIASTALRELRTTDEHRAAVFTKMEASLAQHGERIQRLEQALKIAVVLIREYYDDHRDPKSDDSDWGQSADNKCNWCLDAERVFALAASSAEPLTGETDAQAEQEKKS